VKIMSKSPNAVANEITVILSIAREIYLLLLQMSNANALQLFKYTHMAKIDIIGRRDS
jgi:hypothetical protein